MFALYVTTVYFNIQLNVLLITHSHILLPSRQDIIFLLRCQLILINVVAIVFQTSPVTGNTTTTQVVLASERLKSLEFFDGYTKHKRLSHFNHFLFLHLLFQWVDCCVGCVMFILFNCSVLGALADASVVT